MYIHANLHLTHSHYQFTIVLLEIDLFTIHINSINTIHTHARYSVLDVIAVENLNCVAHIAMHLQLCHRIECDGPHVYLCCVYRIGVNWKQIGLQ